MTPYQRLAALHAPYASAKREFARSLMKGQTGPYMGGRDRLRAGVAYNHPSVKLQQTARTWHACRNCANPAMGSSMRAVATEHINGLVTLGKCQVCKGKGMVYG